MVSLHPRMADPIDPGDEPFLQSRYEAWLAERELMSTAMAIRDAEGSVSASRARIAYEAAWMRFMVALCNLPVESRPLEVERVLEGMRAARVLHGRGGERGVVSNRPQDPRADEEDDV